MKKGQGISINVIVIAAVALIVLVILATLVIRSGSKINQGANSCDAIEGGRCIAAGESCGTDNVRDISRGCPTAEFPVCCRSLVTG